MLIGRAVLGHVLVAKRQPELKDNFVENRSNALRKKDCMRMVLAQGKKIKLSGDSSCMEWNLGEAAALTKDLRENYAIFLLL